MRKEIRMIGNVFNIFVIAIINLFHFLVKNNIISFFFSLSCYSVSLLGQKMQLFVQLMQAQLPLFDTNQCCFEVEKNRETTARIVGWRHLGIKNIYTLECSLAGSNQLPLQVFLIT